jgi:TolA-binding protein
VHRAAILALLLVSVAAAAAPPTTCSGSSPYEQAVCAYQHRQFAEAERAFRAIIEKNESEPATIRSVYFLARTLMKQGHYDEAATLLIRIYSLDPPFYREWNCDFLLGECRRAQGKG